MSDLARLQQFKINAMHGRDVGVWVCEGSGLALSPCLFMQAMCSDPLPRPLLVKWKQSAPLPKSFSRSRALPLIYSECGRIPPWPYYLHLFASQAPVTHAFEQASGLQDWSFAVPMLGIILIFDKKYDGLPATLSFNRLINRSASPKPSWPLAWVQAQHLPYVIAALGYEETRAGEEQFRRRYDVAADIPVIPGPALADARQRGAGGQSVQTGGMFSSAFEHQKLALDPEYARTMLGALFPLSGRKQ